jgi:hypothetical protein
MRFKRFTVAIIVVALALVVSPAMAVDYLVNPAATDQGAAGVRSVKALVDAIGASKKATLVFAHNSAAATTTYSFATSLTIPANVYLRIDPGAKLAIATAKTLTVYSPANLLVQMRQDLFTLTGTGKVAFTVPGTVAPEWWGAAADGTTACATAMQAAITAAAGGGCVRLQAGTYQVATALTMAAPVDIAGVSTVATVINFTGSGNLLKNTAATSEMRWRDFQVTTTGNLNADVDVFDFDKGSNRSLFVGVKIDDTAGVVRHGWVLRGVPAAGGAANNCQYGNLWQQCTVTGSAYGTAWRLYSDGRLNSKCNANMWIKCTTAGANLYCAYDVTGNGNAWYDCTINDVAGPFAMLFRGETYDLGGADETKQTTYNNEVNACYFDAPAGGGAVSPVAFFCTSPMHRSDSTNGQSAPPASFRNCFGLLTGMGTPYTSASHRIFDYDGGTTLTSGVLVAGAAYEITAYAAGDDFTNVGAASNATGVIFVATGTTPTDWTNGTTVVEHLQVYPQRIHNLTSSTMITPNMDTLGTGNVKRIAAPSTQSFTAGTLVVGVRYYITTYAAGDDFTNVGAASNATGVEFEASGTTPTDWTNGSTLTTVPTVNQVMLKENMTTAIVTTAAVNIGAATDAGGALALVSGTKHDGTGNIRFHDVVHVGRGSATAISSLDVFGTPAARTYAASSGQLTVQMAADVYKVQCVILQANRPSWGTN